MRRLMYVWCAALAPAALPAITSAEWFEGFDDYQTGSGVIGQGGWQGWEDNPQGDALVTDLFARSAPNSLQIAGDSDVVHEFFGCDSAQWTFTAWQYVPDDFTGQSYFILLNTYGPPHNWSTQIRFDGGAGVVVSEFEEMQLPLITEQWVELRIVIDLDQDLQTIFYGGTELWHKSWTEGVSGHGELNIAAVNLYGGGADPLYYDDLSLVPAAGVWALIGLAGLMGPFRRRR